LLASLKNKLEEKMRLKKSVLSLVVVLIVCFSVLMLVQSLSAGDINKCHRYCGKAYPDDFGQYLACMDGCLHG
jgi:hypothetical protein